LLFQQFTFEVIFKSGKSNVGPYHLSRLDSGELGGSVDDEFPNDHLFHIEVVHDYIEEIITFLATIQWPSDYTTVQRNNLVVR